MIDLDYATAVVFIKKSLLIAIITWTVCETLLDMKLTALGLLFMACLGLSSTALWVDISYVYQAAEVHPQWIQKQNAFIFSIVLVLAYKTISSRIWVKRWRAFRGRLVEYLSNHGIN